MTRPVDILPTMNRLAAIIDACYPALEASGFADIHARIRHGVEHPLAYAQRPRPQSVGDFAPIGEGAAERVRFVVEHAAGEQPWRRWGILSTPRGLADFA